MNNNTVPIITIKPIESSVQIDGNQEVTVWGRTWKVITDIYDWLVEKIVTAWNNFMIFLFGADKPQEENLKKHEEEQTTDVNTNTQTQPQTQPQQSPVDNTNTQNQPQTQPQQPPVNNTNTQNQPQTQPQQPPVNNTNTQNQPQTQPQQSTLDNTNPQPQQLKSVEKTTQTGNSIINQLNTFPPVPNGQTKLNEPPKNPITQTMGRPTYNRGKYRFQGTVTDTAKSVTATIEKIEEKSHSLIEKIANIKIGSKNEAVDLQDEAEDGAKSEINIRKPMDQLFELAQLNKDIQGKIREANEAARKAGTIKTNEKAEVVAKAKAVVNACNDINLAFINVMEGLQPKIFEAFYTIFTELQQNQECFQDEFLRSTWKMTLSFLIDFQKMQYDNEKFNTLHGLEFDLKMSLQKVDTYTKRIEEQQRAARKAEVSGRVGIPNIGNSCWMNSSLQAVLGTKISEKIPDMQEQEIPDNLEQEPLDEPMNVKQERLRTKANNKLIKEEAKKFKKAYNNAENFNDMINAADDFRNLIFTDDPINGAVTPLALDVDEETGKIKKNGQHDAPELLGPLLSALGVKYQLKSHKNFGDGQPMSKVEDQSIVQISIPEPDIITRNEKGVVTSRKVSSKKLFENFSKATIELDRTKNENTGEFHNQYQQQYSIVGDTPDILVVQLKRFTYNKGLKKLIKIDIPIQYSEGDDFDLKSLFDPSLHIGNKSFRYKLTGYIDHWSNHYTANVCPKGKWIKCNDSGVSLATDEKKDREAAYVLIFEKLNEEEYIPPVQEPIVPQQQQPLPQQQPLQQRMQPQQQKRPQGNQVPRQPSDYTPIPDGKVQNRITVKPNGAPINRPNPFNQSPPQKQQFYRANSQQRQVPVNKNPQFKPQQPPVNKNPQQQNPQQQPITTNPPQPQPI